MAAKIAIMAITTRSSIRVKPRWVWTLRSISLPPSLRQARGCSVRRHGKMGSIKRLVRSPTAPLGPYASTVAGDLPSGRQESHLRAGNGVRNDVYDTIAVGIA